MGLTTCATINDNEYVFWPIFISLRRVPNDWMGVPFAATNRRLKERVLLPIAAAGQREICEPESRRHWWPEILSVTSPRVAGIALTASLGDRPVSFPKPFLLRGEPPPRGKPVERTYWDPILSTTAYISGLFLPIQVKRTQSYRFHLLSRLLWQALFTASSPRSKCRFRVRPSHTHLCRSYSCHRGCPTIRWQSPGLVGCLHQPRQLTYPGDRKSRWRYALAETWQTRAWADLPTSHRPSTSEAQAHTLTGVHLLGLWPRGMHQAFVLASVHTFCTGWRVSPHTGHLLSSAPGTQITFEESQGPVLTQCTNILCHSAWCLVNENLHLPSGTILTEPAGWMWVTGPPHYALLDRPTCLPPLPWLPARYSTHVSVDSSTVNSAQRWGPERWMRTREPSAVDRVAAVLALARPEARGHHCWGSDLKLTKMYSGKLDKDIYNVLPKEDENKKWTSKWSNALKSLLLHPFLLIMTSSMHVCWATNPNWPAAPTWQHIRSWRPICI